MFLLRRSGLLKCVPHPTPEERKSVARREPAAPRSFSPWGREKCEDTLRSGKGLRPLHPHL